MRAITYITGTKIFGDDPKETVIVAEPKDVESVQKDILEFVKIKFKSLIDEVARIDKSKPEVTAVTEAIGKLKDGISDPDKNPVVQLVSDRAGSVIKLIKETERTLNQTEKEMRSLANASKDLCEQCENTSEAMVAKCTKITEDAGKKLIEPVDERNASAAEKYDDKLLALITLINETKLSFSQAGKEMQALVGEAQKLCTRSLDSSEKMTGLCTQIMEDARKKVIADVYLRLAEAEGKSSASLGQMQLILDQCRSIFAEAKTMHERHRSGTIEIELKAKQIDAILCAKTFGARMRWLLRGVAVKTESVNTQI